MDVNVGKDPWTVLALEENMLCYSRASMNIWSEAHKRTL